MDRWLSEREARYYLVVRIIGHGLNDSPATSRHNDRSSQGAERKRVAKSGRRTSNTFEKQRQRERREETEEESERGS
ncbi:hypothetical protein BO83DRAFT_375957 [Aspergillus eucalypticola CBS 122712]|uniref:Uncharacterized protein n=1 Tax=Aspergillus eucalypticola (strain CBS 122712 / IBT 29274) TaxID=1448314 RepID=A0A317W401_ASPEC|nr:uncharacterized protein BO83DRAFT_375957 [Aspergillus eucalypticola CBS 122712]PWY80012.1 hypothetical protein BO83DRAFT_375957 [Aspergillus eucalypticola CBS 122712]